MAASRPSWRGRPSRERCGAAAGSGRRAGWRSRRRGASWCGPRPARWRAAGRRGGGRGRRSPGPRRRSWRSAAARRGPARRTASRRRRRRGGPTAPGAHRRPRSGSRLVVRIRTLGQPCEQGDDERRRGVGDVLAVVEDHDGVAVGEPLDRPARRPSGRPVRFGRPLRRPRRRRRRRRRTAAPSTSGASSTNHTSRSLAIRWASSRVRRDLPTPAGPTTVTRRARPSVATTSVSSRAASDERRQR